MTTRSFVALVTEYVALRRQLGYGLESARWVLLDFARCADAAGRHRPLTVDLVVRWAQSSDSRDPCAAARRLAIVRPFMRHHAAFDPATEVPAAGLLGPMQIRKPPHIYSDTEIAALLRETARLGRPGRLRPRTLATILALLTSTGMRVSEVCHLAHRDVDLDDGVVIVRESKFRKSRLVPLHPSTTAALARYVADRDAAQPRSKSFFRTDQAGRVTRITVARTFAEVRHRLGWSADGRARLPRVHDLRHTFAVRRLVRWYEEGADLDRKVHALATYLGHTGVSGTYWYLTAIPELLALTSKRFEHFADRGRDGTP